MRINELKSDYYGTEKIWKIIRRVAPPVMLALLIQSLYNVVDSYFLGKSSEEALNALTVIYPLQLIIIAFAVGTGVGVNTFMAKLYALNKEKQANETAGVGNILAIFSWVIFAVLSFLIMRPFCHAFVKSELAEEYAIIYGNIVCIGSLGAYLEGNYSKVLQSKGDMALPMIAEIVGAIVNIILDPILIFGWWIFPQMGVAGAGVATIIGQFVSAVIVGINGFRMPPKFKVWGYYIKKIYFYGYSSIFMQALYTVYILFLNAILTKFCDEAITVLGLYYKLQSFFFIPLTGLMTCIVPILSFNYTRKEYDRCKETMRISFLISGSFMIIGMIAFIGFPSQLISLFSKSEKVHEIGVIAFRIIGSGFISASFALMMPVVFQAIGYGKISVFLSILRQILCLVPSFWAFSFIGLNYVWIAFPLSETVSGLISLIIYINTTKKWKKARNDLSLTN